MERGLYYKVICLERHGWQWSTGGQLLSSERGTFDKKRNWKPDPDRGDSYCSELIGEVSPKSCTMSLFNSLEIMHAEEVDCCCR